MLKLKVAYLLTRVVVCLDEEGALGGVQGEVGTDGGLVVHRVGEGEGEGLSALHLALHRHLLHGAHHLDRAELY